MTDNPDRFTEEARRIVGIVLYNEECDSQVAEQLRQVAREEALRVLDHVRRNSLRSSHGDTLAELAEVRARIEKGEF